ncbi:MAG: fumarate hydratase C-terminal domain-containing protein [Pirellulales bacterium]|nr:fumarate hydratase C-terminal domain-containing protein [Pirellulales bacterium]
MELHELQTPLDENAVRRLRAGDQVTLHGHVFGLRDKTHIEIFDRGQTPPVSFDGYPVLHTAPSLRKVGEKWEKVIIGTTTSMRMDRYVPDLIERYGVRAFIGKAGLSERSLEAMQRFGACYLAIVGGAAGLETLQIEEVEAVYWPHLHPEAIYQLRVSGLGPLIVAMDAHGESLYDVVRNRAQRNLSEIYRRWGIDKKIASQTAAYVPKEQPPHFRREKRGAVVKGTK